MSSYRILIFLGLLGCPAPLASEPVDSGMAVTPVVISVGQPPTPEQVRTTAQERVSVEQESQLDKMIQELTTLHHKLHKLKKGTKQPVAVPREVVSAPMEPDPTIISAPPVSVGLETIGTPMGEDITYTGSGGTQTDMAVSSPEYPLGGY